MKLYILRHAIAEERDENLYPDDSLRHLTEKGKKKMAKIAKHLCDMGVQIDLILTSPYIRAYETARIVAKTFGIKKRKIVLTDHLTPSGFAKDLIAEINEKYLVDNLILVGHEPFLSDLIAVLVAGDPSMSVVMKKGGLCRLSIDNLVYDKCATLDWLLMPGQVTRMGKLKSG
jgi:phosphohistidine phosphatase